MNYISVLWGNAKLMLKYVWYRMLGHTNNRISFPQLISADTVIRFNKGNILLGKKIKTKRKVYLVAVHGGTLDIGDRVFFNQNCIVVCQEHISIGSGTSFGPNVCLYDHDHRFDENGVYGDCKTGTIEIGEGCWIGAGAIILRNTVIGAGSVIGAGTVVKGVIPPHSLVTNDCRMKVVPIHRKEIPS